MKTRSLTWYFVAVAILAGVLLVVGANAHMLYVALASAPECITHLKTGDTEPGRFSAARSDCGG
jgi:hypothetical protein